MNPNFKCIITDGIIVNEGSDEAKAIFKTYYLVDINGNAFKCFSDKWLVSKFIEIENDDYAIGTLRQFNTFDEAHTYSFSIKSNNL